MRTAVVNKASSEPDYHNSSIRCACPLCRCINFSASQGVRCGGGGVSAQRGHAAPAKGQLDLALDMLVYLQPGIPTPSAITAARTERKYTYNQVK